MELKILVTEWLVQEAKNGESRVTFIKRGIKKPDKKGNHGLKKNTLETVESGIGRRLKKNGGIWRSKQDTGR